MNKTPGGCGIASCLFLIVCSVVMIFFAPQTWNWTRRSIVDHFNGKEAQAREFDEILSGWVPPSANASKEDLMPKLVSLYVRQTLDENTAIPELNLTRKGWHAFYSSSNDSIDVFVFKAFAEDWNKIKEDSKRAFEKLTDRSWFCSENSCTFNRYSDGPDFFLVWNKDWIYIFSSVDLENHRSFVNDFYLSTGKKAVVKTEIPSEHSLIDAIRKKDYQKITTEFESGYVRLDLKDRDQTPISILALKTDDEFILDEVVKYANLDTVNSQGQTALMIAATGATDFMAQHFRTLLENGANIYLRDHSGQSALMYAVKANNSAAVKLLIEAGADITINDNNGHSAMTLAKQKIPRLLAAAEFPQIESFETKPGWNDFVHSPTLKLTPARLRKFQRPKYPEDSGGYPQFGTVVLSGHVDADSKVYDLKITKSANPSLDQAALRIVSSWQLLPTSVSTKGMCVYPAPGSSIPVLWPERFVRTEFSITIRYEKFKLGEVCSQIHDF